MSVLQVLEDYDILECEECHCKTGNDWFFVDFTNKNVIECPQCKTRISIDDYKEYTVFVKYADVITTTYARCSDEAETKIDRVLPSLKENT